MDSVVVFCRFCEHSIDFSRVDSVNDHLNQVMLQAEAVGNSE